MDIPSHLVHRLVHAREEEVNRAVQAFEKAVAASDRPKSVQSLRPIGPTEPFSTAQVTHSNGRTLAIAPIPVRASITEYTRRELQTLLEWVRSDGKLRTNDELVDEMFAALPFARRGSKIESSSQESHRRRMRFARAKACLLAVGDLHKI